MSETQAARRAWAPEETAALLAAVEQCRATGGQLDWHAIAAAIPGRGAQSAAVQFYKLEPAQPPRRRVASPEGAMVAFLPIRPTSPALSNRWPRWRDAVAEAWLTADAARLPSAGFNSTT
jgi:hypothetical protein